jgi:hypothetical protein
MDRETRLAIEFDDDAGPCIVADDARAIGKQRIPGLDGARSDRQETGGQKRRQNPPCDCRSPRCGFRRDPSPLKQ